MLEPYSKANCLAMLNTLFPPMTSAAVQPTSQLTPKILQCQRDGFWLYINAIESNGKQILDKVMNQGAREGDQTAWPMTRDALDKYLRNADDIINECFEVNGRDSLETESFYEAHKSRKVDSGVSFSPSEQSQTGQRDSDSGFSGHQCTPPPDVKGRKVSSSTLERSVRRIRGSDSEKEKYSKGPKQKPLKKAKSSSALGRSAGSGSSSPSFGIDELRRRQLIWEATYKKYY
jgi:hypothetical protein